MKKGSNKKPNAPKKLGQNIAPWPSHCFQTAERKFSKLAQYDTPKNLGAVAIRIRFQLTT